jgi:hypothetical protein
MIRSLLKTMPASAKVVDKVILDTFGKMVLIRIKSDGIVPSTCLAISPSRIACSTFSQCYYPFLLSALVPTSPYQLFQFNTNLTDDFTLQFGILKKSDATHGWLKMTKHFEL